MNKPLLKLEEYRDKSIWKKLFTEETAKLFEDNELVPLDLIDITSEELEELIKSRSLESKSKVRRLKRELETLDEVKKEKKLEVEEVIVEKRVESRRNFRKEELPVFESTNLIKFYYEFDKFLKIEDINENDWFDVFIKAIPWEEGGAKLYGKYEK